MGFFFNSIPNEPFTPSAVRTRAIVNAVLSFNEFDYNVWTAHNPNLRPSWVGAASVVGVSVVQPRREMSPAAADRPAYLADAALHQGSATAQ